MCERGAFGKKRKRMVDKNGAWQLVRLTLRYCPIGGSSAGIRAFLRSAQIDPSITTNKTLRRFAEENPQLQIVAKVKRNRHPSLFGEYRVHEKYTTLYDPDDFKTFVNNPEDRPAHTVCVKNIDMKAIYKTCVNFRNSTGRQQNMLLKKPIFRESDSIQGHWKPFLTSQTTFTIRNI